MKPQCRLVTIATLVALAAAAGGTAGDADSQAGSGTPFREESVSYRNEDLSLAAALLVPQSEAAVPGVVVLQGSGPSDRTNAWARAIAEGLAARGVAVLLTDKRGSGQSGGDWRTADMEDLAEDGLAGVEYLRGREEVDGALVGLLGLSQGGHVAPFAAAIGRDVAFVVAASAAATRLGEQMDHEMRNTFRQAGLPEEGVEKGMEIQRLAERYVRTGDWQPYAAALAAAVGTPLAPVAAGFPQTPDSWVWGWVRRVGDYDPIPYWKMVGSPALVVFGRDDERDNVPVAESVRRLEEAFAGRAAPWKVHVFEGSGHALYAPGAAEPRIREDFLDLVRAWIEKGREPMPAAPDGKP
jgi:uncharacterized protein